MDQAVQNLLLKAGLLSRAHLDKSLDEARQRKMPLLDVLIEGRYVSDDVLAETFAQWSRIPRIRLAAVSIQSEATRAISEGLARKYCCLPVSLEEGKLVLAMANPLDFEAVQDLEFATGLRIKPVVASRAEILDGIEERYTTSQRLTGFLEFVPEVTDIRITSDEGSVPPPPAPDETTVVGGVEMVEVAEAGADDAPVVKMVNVIIRDAIEARASDIHIEPGLHTVQVRLRVDGTLRDFMQVPKWLQNAVVSRLKILAKLDISEKRLPQDGRVNVQCEGRQVDVRVSTLPTLFGEKVVLRLLGTQTLPDFAEMGLSPAQIQLIRAALHQPQGTIIVTGPTGSGKSTSLYAMVQARRSPELNIVTVEDPIEYRLEGIAQVQVNTKAGLTFASTLRAILRQDPDVILLGEIRDLETAQIAFQASQTGHLVLTTLHTGSAVATVTRLIDLGIEPFLISSAVNLIMAQRLARRVCSACGGRKTAAVPETGADPAQGALIKLSDAVAPRSCEACGGTGYAGRVGIYELLPMTPRIRELIHNRASEAELRKAAMQAGMTFLIQDAQDKIKAGLTTQEEVARVIQAEEEATILCPKCRAVLGADFAACPYCLHTMRRRCSSCGQDLRAEWKMCPYCSTRVEEAGAPAAPAAARPRLPAPAPAADIRFESVVDAASWPAVSSPAPIPPGSVAEDPERRKLRILVVDDDRDIQRIVAWTVSRLPVETDVRTADDGADALEKIGQAIPDLIILDVNMPRLDGFGVCERLRSDIRTAFVPILMLTASTDEASRTRGYLVGTDDYMSKPFVPPDLNLRVTRLLRRTYGV